jgi:membrane-associated phospholipid phosphatase
MRHYPVVILNAAPWLLGLPLWLAATADTRAGDAIQSAGDILQLVLPATAAGLTLAYQDWHGTLQFGESAGVTLGLTYGLKYSVPETRPNGGSESFPSAHTSISFCSAEFLRKRYGWEYGIPAYAAASFVAYSRVEAGEHHPQDVVAGAAIGITTSFLFTRPYKGWTIQLEGDTKHCGIRLKRSW